MTQETTNPEKPPLTQAAVVKALIGAVAEYEEMALDDCPIFEDPALKLGLSALTKASILGGIVITSKLLKQHPDVTPQMIFDAAMEVVQQLSGTVQIAAAELKKFQDAHAQGKTDKQPG